MKICGNGGIVGIEEEEWRSRSSKIGRKDVSSKGELFVLYLTEFCLCVCCCRFILSLNTGGN